MAEHFDYTGSDGFASLLSSLDITIAGTNDAPILAKALADMHVNFNKAFWFQLPAGSFVDVDQGGTLVYSATLADGSALPSWLKFDGATGTFSGTAPKQVTSFDVRLSATDKASGAGANLSVSDVFKLHVNHGNNGGGNGVDAAPNGQQTDKDSPPVDNPWVPAGQPEGQRQDADGAGARERLPVWRRRWRPCPAGRRAWRPWRGAVHRLIEDRRRGTKKGTFALARTSLSSCRMRGGRAARLLQTGIGRLLFRSRKPRMMR